MINCNYSAVKCPHYTTTEGESERTVFIGPIKIFEGTRDNGERANDIIGGCNWYQTCEQAGCIYSWAAHQEKRKLGG